MADTEVIRSFLVSLGVQVDERGLKRFDQTLGRITKTAAEFAGAMLAAATAASAAVLKVSSEFEDLYYASQRLRSSVDNIKAFSFGLAQMGGDSKSARASLEAFSDFMRSNPMGEGFVRGLGVETRDAAGGMREYADVVRDLGAEFRKMPYWAAKQRAAMLGIDDNTLQALLRGTDAWSDRYRRLVADSGVDMDQMSKDLTNLAQNFRLLRAQIEIYFYKAIQHIRPEVMQTLIVLAAFGGALALIVTFAGPVAGGIVAIGAAIALLADDFNGWREGADSLINWGQWSDEIDLVIAGLGELGAAFGELFGALAPVGEAIARDFGPLVRLMITGLIMVIHTLTSAVQIIIDILRGDGAKAWGDFKSAGVRAIDDIKRSLGALKDLWDADSGKTPAARTPTGPSAAARAGALRAPAANDNRTTPAQRGSRAEAMNYFMRQGWTREQAAGIVANLASESGINPRSVGDGGQAYGIAQWHPDRQANFRKWAGKDIRDSTVAEQLAFVNYELTRGSEAAAGRQLSRARTAQQAGAVVSSQYERPRDRLGEMAKRGRTAETVLAGHRLGTDGGAKNVTINAKTDIKVHGATDAKETGKAVGDAVDRKNADLVRNTRTAVK